MVCIEVSDNVSHGLSAGVHLKDFPYNGSGVRVKLEVLFIVCAKAQRHISACGQALFGVDIHAPATLL